MPEVPDGAAPYPHVGQQPDFPAMEVDTLAFWAREGIFAESVEARPGGANEYVFYDGPPFANGLPHYGHLLTGFVKDAVPRYQTMRGRRVERRFGWDCHGLPAETSAETELDVKGRAAIIEYGVDRFNDYCRSLVLRTTDAWERYVTRQARWVDFRNDYKTMDIPYMESVMWAFKALWDKGFVYEGERVLAYCWECETPLSNFETRQDDSYRDREDPAVTVAFTLDPLEGSLGSALTDGALRVLVWTTTPWTLPSNLALAVGPDITYAVYDLPEGPTLIAQSCAEEYADVLGDAEPIALIQGSALVGRRYRPLFDFFADVDGAFVVLGADFVAVDEGTGVVHMAPGFGEDDYWACTALGLPVVCPVDDRARFTAEVAPYQGLQVFEANAPIVQALRDLGVLVRQRPYLHSYPHCWRTDTPLIYKAVSSWLVEVTAFKSRMIELNEQIDWIPAHVKNGAFGKWLEGARDWPISRNRFWGAPIPVWRSDDPSYPRIDVYGSLDELERDFGVRPADLHRPAIDELVRPNPDDPTGRSTMRRVTDVLDCWFESGSMPFAQVHYPFENAEWFESHFPADFIVEYVSQTRGWFYTLHVLSTALFDCPPFSHCVVHGVVLGHDGRKMSKRLGNYPDPDMVFDTWGADAMRWMLLSSAVLRGQDLVVHAKAFDEVRRQVLNPIWNAWYFLCLYADVDGVRGRRRVDATGVLDRYALAKTAELVHDVERAMDCYDLFGACSAVTSFLDALNNWYIRRSRERFWRSRDGSAEVEQDKADAYDTLSTVLATLCEVAAPLLPLLTEAIYRPLTGARSVHLADWPGAHMTAPDPELVRAMDLVREVCSAAHAVRKATGRRVRLPLRTLTVATDDPALLEPYSAIIEDEVNVKSVVLTTDVGGLAERVLAVVPSELGPRLGPDTQRVIRAVKQGKWSHTDDGVIVDGITLAPGEYNLALRPLHAERGRTLPGEMGVIVLDTDVDAELEDEGVARDVVREIQEARKAAGYHIADRVTVLLAAPEPTLRAVERHRSYVMEQTLADELRLEQAQNLAVTVDKRG
ncbi:MAG: isoleucine--tRNA ligase [Acidimicrobiales bacterium]